MDERGAVMRYRASEERELEKFMGRKRHIDPVDSEAVRNGIGVSRPGDKLYSDPAYAPDFFKGGGIIPGSSWGCVSSFGGLGAREAGLID